MEVINDNLSLNTRKFKIGANIYEIRGSKNGVDDKIYNVIDSVKNLENNKVKDYRRADLKIMLKKYSAKFVK